MRKTVACSIWLCLWWLMACSQQSDFADNERLDKGRIIRVEGNVTYDFPNSSPKSERDYTVAYCKKAIQENLAVLKEEVLEDSIKIIFVLSRQEMQDSTGTGARGIAEPWNKRVYVVLDENAPIAHELMHLVAMLKWGGLPRSSYWMNEGLATVVGGTCSDYTLEEIYTYFLQSDKLLPITELGADFYSTPEMVGYPQSAYLVAYLLENFDIQQFINLWRGGIEAFEAIYGFPIENLQEQIRTTLTQKNTTPIEFDWEEFQKGCE